MAMSGVTIDENVAKSLGELRLKKSRYVIMRIGANGRQITVVEVGPREATYEEFVQKIATEEPCYAGYDYEFTLNGMQHDKLLLVQWIPENAKPRSKMLYSSSSDALNGVKEGFLSVQANDVSELDPAEIIRKIKSHRFA